MTTDNTTAYPVDPVDNLTMGSIPDNALDRMIAATRPLDEFSTAEIIAEIDRRITGLDDPVVVEALEHRCGVCRADVGTLCAKTIGSEPLIGDLVHLNRGRCSP